MTDRLKTEAELTAKVCKELRELGALVYPVVAGRFAAPGWPDRIVWHRQWCGFVEFKAAKTVVQPVQWEVVRQLNIRQPFSAIVARFGLDGAPGELYFEQPLPSDGATAWNNTGRDLLELIGLARKHLSRS